jgi:hypothetical protein
MRIKDGQTDLGLGFYLGIEIEEGEEEGEVDADEQR